MIKPLAKQVFVTPIFDPDMIGHIIIPDMAKDRCDQGIVKYVGSQVDDLRIGDYVFFSGYTGTLLHIEGEGTLIVLRREFVIAVDDLEHEHLQVPGLYFKSRIPASPTTNGSDIYIPATYEQIFEFLSQAITDAGLSYKVKTPKPKKEEYEQLTGGV